MEKFVFEQIAKENNTPSYVFNLDLLSERLKMIKEQLGDTATLCYAMKANPFLIHHMEKYIDRFEVCSPGEFAICERANIPTGRIVLSGVNKEYDEIKRVINTYAGEGVYTIESEQQLEILVRCTQERKQAIKVLIRLTSGNQFGMDESTIVKILNEWNSYPHLEFMGIQFYSGTQKKKISIIEKELKMLDEFCLKLKRDLNINVPELEYGPGFYTSYFENEDEINDIELLSSFKELLKDMEFGGKITLEMGRYMVAACGYYITTIIDKKKNLDQNYCIIDGGINHINYYGQAMAMKVPSILHIPQINTGEVERWNVCGSLCTVGDIIVKQLPLQNISINDILVFGKLGAYSITEGIYLFLSRDLPKVFFYSKEKGIQLVRDTQATNTINSIY